jgi:hypothetical protein
MSEEHPSVNRRLAPRLACQLVVRYRTDGAERPATAVDLSNRGCRLRVGQDLARGTPLTVFLDRRRDAPEGGGPAEVAVTGRVVWCRSEGLSHQVGVAFSAEPAGLQAILESV